MIGVPTSPLDLIPRWALVGAIVALSATVCVGAFQLERAKAETARAQRDKANAERDVATLTASLETAKADAAKQALGWQAKLSEAERNGRERENNLRAAAAAAGTELDGLRSDVANLRRSLEDATAAAAADRAVAIGSVFEQCATRYSKLAASCDRHANDVRTLIEAWPK